MMSGLFLLCLQCALIALSHGDKAVGQVSMDVHKKFMSVESTQDPVRMVFKEKSKHELRIDFRRTRRSDRNRNHEVVFAVKQRNLDELERILKAVSDPKSKMYGKHKTRKEVSELTANYPSSQHIIMYLKNLNIAVSRVSKHEDFIAANAPIRVWESLFGTEFYEFESVDGSHENVDRALEYSIPEHLANHVHAVFNTVQLPLVNTIRAIVNKKTSEKSPIHADASGVLLSGYVTPQLLSNAYNIPTMNGTINSTQAVYSDGSNYFSPSDLSVFQKNFKLYQNPVSTVIGGNSNDAICVSNPNACGESNLDVEYLMGVSQMSPTTYHHYSGNQAFLGWIEQVANLTEPALVHSISFGFDEFSGYDSYFTSFNIEAIKLGVMGVTILASSGDDGAVGAKVRSSWTNCMYHPSFPASSPYVTAVGGSMGPEAGSKEVVCQTDNGGTITSGGGFSTLFKVPEWQANFTSAYLASVAGTEKDPFIGYAADGRGIPDISLAAENYAVYIGGSRLGVSGTSASCPAFAGMISLVNAKRMASGKSPLGWINPALYANSELFVNDITDGDNKCGVGPTCCSQGFYAADGWDPVSGLGSVNFNNMLNMFMSLGDDVLNAPSANPTPGVTAPSVLPTRTPSMTPTTTMPTTPSGWLSFGIYAKEGCANPLNFMTSVKTDECFELFSNGVSADKYILYSCDAVEGHFAYYSDSNCTQLLDTPTDFALGCATSVADTSSNVIGSAVISCTSSTTLPLDTAQNYMTQRNYNTGGCDDSAFSSFDAYLKDTCVNNFGTPTKALLTSLNTYSSMSTCTSNGVASTSLSITVNSCGVKTDGSANDDTDAFNTKWTFDAATTTYSPTRAPTTYRPTRVPSAKPSTIKPTCTPSIAPSLVPTSAPTIYSYYKFSVQQILVGISEAKYNANSTRNDLILRHAVAACMSGMSYQNISVRQLSAGPSIDGTAGPTALPSAGPTVNTLIPTGVPTVEPSSAPTISQRPTVVPTVAPSMAPTISMAPTESPTTAPTQQPSISQHPSVAPTEAPTRLPTVNPSQLPTMLPTLTPTVVPSTPPSAFPTLLPSLIPSMQPSQAPTEVPSEAPTFPITNAPTVSPSRGPTAVPTQKPTKCPTLAPSCKPTRSPTPLPTVNTRGPTTSQPSQAPSMSMEPTDAPTETPSEVPTLSQPPSEQPSESPSSEPTTPSLLRRRSLAATSTFTVESVNVTYDVHFDISALGYDTPEPAYVALTTALQNAVDSGLFNSHLASFAAYFGGGNMTGVTSSSISVSNYTVDITQPGQNDDDDGTGSLAIPTKDLIIIGISIAAGLGMFCVGIMIVFFCNGEATVAPMVSQK